VVGAKPVVVSTLNAEENSAMRAPQRIAFPGNKLLLIVNADFATSTTPSTVSCIPRQRDG
jgi:hypothetical protein